MFTPDSVIRNQEHRIGTIIQSDPTNNQLVLKDNKFGNPINISLTFHDDIASYPAVGEIWMVTRNGNGTEWILEKRLENGTEQPPFSDLQSGDRRIYAPGELFIVGNPITLSGVINLPPEGQFILTVDDNEHNSVSPVNQITFNGATVSQGTNQEVIVTTTNTEDLGNFIQFDKYPQSGDWIYITTTGFGPNDLGIDLNSITGFSLKDNSNNGIIIEEHGNGGISINNYGNEGISIVDSGIPFGGGLFLASANTGTYPAVTLTALEGAGIAIMNPIGAATSSGSGLYIYDASPTGMYLLEGGDGGILIEDEGEGGITLRETGNFGIFLDDRGGGGIELKSNNYIYLTTDTFTDSLNLSFDGNDSLISSDFLQISSFNEMDIRTTSSGSSLTVEADGGEGQFTSNLYLNASPLVVTQYGFGAQSVVGVDPQVTVPGPNGTPGQDSVFEVMGSYSDSTDTWEWNGTIPQWNNASLGNTTTSGVGPGPAHNGFSETGGMAYDPIHNYTIFLADNTSETWTYNGSRWTNLGVLPGTPTVFGDTNTANLIYDTANSRILCFSLGFSSNYYLQTSYWTGSSWSTITPTIFPNFSIFNFSIGYDETHGRVVLWVGSSGDSSLDTWTFYSNDWHQETPINFPTPRDSPGMAFDHNKGKLMLFSGDRHDADYGYFDVWSWDGSNWTEEVINYITPTSSPTTIAPPPYERHQFCCVWDGTQIMIFGGEISLYNYASFNDTLRDTWVYDGNTNNLTFQALTPLPPGRWWGNEAAMASYDSSRGKVVMYGGAIDATGLLISNAEINDGVPVLHLKQGMNIVFDL